MSRAHARRRAQHKALAPALWLAGVVVALFISSLVAIVLLLHHLAQLLLQLAGLAAGL